MRKPNSLLVKTFVIAAAVGAGCGDRDRGVLEAEQSVTERDLERHVLVLASDEFEGRAPFTRGEEKTVAYIEGEFRRMGLEGANEGSFIQEVPLVEITVHPPERVSIATGSGAVDLDYPEDFIASTSRIASEVRLDRSELVFAGYGIVADEYDWDDYAGLEWEGKTALVLVNDPGFATGDESLFSGRAMTYYGRWTYKYEEAARRGAEGVFVIHETQAAGYPWSVLENGAERNLVLRSEDDNRSRCAVEGWVTEDAARELFRKAGLDFDALAQASARPGFRPVPLGAALTMAVDCELRFDASRNVMGVLRGATRPEECIVYTAHWDHLGIGPPVDGDSIYNGAADNGLPLACMLETAEAFTHLDVRPGRSILFIAVTAEESGLLGSEYYVTHPVCPLDRTAAALNYELFLPLGRMKDVTVYGRGKSELDDYVAAAAAAQGRHVAPDATPEIGMYYRTDHFSFAKAGVPALFVKGWQDHAERGPEWTQSRIDDYWKNVYHTPRDEYDPATADLSGIAEDARLFFRVGYRLAEEEGFPQWREGSEFRRPTAISR